MMPVQELEAAVARRGVTINRLEPRLGAEIEGVDLRQPVDDELRDILYAAMVRHRVIFLRDQHITAEQHVAFGRGFGKLEVHPLNTGEDGHYKGDGHSEILAVRTQQRGLAEFSGRDDGAANNWHTDMTQRPCPPALAILRGVEIPPLGGDTCWASAVSAYDGLDAATKAQIEPLLAVHDTRPAQRRYAKTAEDLERIDRENPPSEHPVVRVHPDTGERMLFVNAGQTKSIVGMAPDESDALLEKLYAQFSRPEYQVRFRWRPNSIAIWDERSTQHYAVQGFEGLEERIMHRICVVGDEPFGPAKPRP